MFSSYCDSQFTGYIGFANKFYGLVILLNPVIAYTWNNNMVKNVKNFAYVSAAEHLANSLQINLSTYENELT